MSKTKLTKRRFSPADIEYLVAIGELGFINGRWRMTALPKELDEDIICDPNHDNGSTSKKYEEWLKKRIKAHHQLTISKR